MWAISTRLKGSINRTRFCSSSVPAGGRVSTQGTKGDRCDLGTEQAGMFVVCGSHAGY